MAASYRDGDVHTSSLLSQYVAERNNALRPGFVDGKSTERRATARKIKLAGRNKAVCERLHQPQPDAVGKNNGVSFIVIDKFAGQLAAVCTRAHRERRKPQ